MGGSSRTTPTGTATWLDLEWRTDILGWAEQALSLLGRQLDGDVEQPHVRPWSTVFRISTSDGVTWLKASGPAGAHEGRLLELFRARNLQHVLLPLAVHPEHPWILFDEGGPTLRQVRPLSEENRDLSDWQRLLPEYAALQRSLESDQSVEQMLAEGTPDGRPQAIVGELSPLAGRRRCLGRLTADEARSGRRRPQQLARQALGDRRSCRRAIRQRPPPDYPARRPPRRQRAGHSTRRPVLRLGRRGRGPSLRHADGDLQLDRAQDRPRPETVRSSRKLESAYLEAWSDVGFAASP